MVLLAITQLDTHGRAPAPTLPRPPRTKARSYYSLQPLQHPLVSHAQSVRRQLRRTQTHVRTHTADDMGCVTSIFCICIVALAAVSVPTSLKLGTAGVGRRTAGPAEDQAAAASGERRARGGVGRRRRRRRHIKYPIRLKHIKQIHLAQTFSSKPAAERTRARRPRAARARTATPRCRRARRRLGPVPPGTSRGCARRIARVARGSALR